MKLRLMIPKRKKLRATAARRVPQPRAMEDDEEEPTMKLSSAFIVVVLLHLVAVGGIYAFESIKVHHPAAVDASELVPVAAAAIPAKAPAPVRQTAPAVRESAAAAPAPVAKSSAPSHAAPVAHAAPAGPKDSGSIHTVVKGENPTLIARRLGVSEADLLKLNRIDDPTKLQIGQKLHIPTKAKTASR